MGLNNKGWGLFELIIGIAIILVFLFIAVFYSLRLNRILQNGSVDNNNNIKEEIDKDYYVLKQSDIMDACNRYIRNEDVGIVTDYYTKISLAEMVNKGYISRIYDRKTKNECIGYALVDKDYDNVLDIKAYLKCDSYETKGYGEK